MNQQKLCFATLIYFDTFRDTINNYLMVTQLIKLNQLKEHSIKPPQMMCFFFILSLVAK